MDVSIIIPTLNPEPDASRALQDALEAQTLDHQLVIVDSGSTIDPASTWPDADLIHTISKGEFGHGRTRNLGAALANGEVLVFLTQDALPADSEWLDKLTAAVRSGEVVATYGRQLPRENASALEIFARLHNYPEESETRTLGSVSRMGVKAYFFSNVCSCVKRDAFDEVGGFPTETIVNEDMILAAKLLHTSYSLRYAAAAAVIHSHDYTLLEQFKRNFDIGVALKEAAAQLEGASSMGAGLTFVKEQTRYLASNGAWTLLPKAILEAAVKFAAYHMGKRHRALPLALKKNLSMHSYHWDQQPSEQRTSAAA